jgi:hypothetical protein
LECARGRRRIRSRLPTRILSIRALLYTVYIDLAGCYEDGAETQGVPATSFVAVTINQLPVVLAAVGSATVIDIRVRRGCRQEHRADRDSARSDDRSEMRD